MLSLGFPLCRVESIGAVLFPVQHRQTDGQMFVKPNTTMLHKGHEILQKYLHLNFPEYIQGQQTTCNIDHMFVVDSFKAMEFHCKWTHIFFHFSPWWLFFVGIEGKASWVEVKLCHGHRLLVDRLENHHVGKTWIPTHWRAERAEVHCKRENLCKQIKILSGGENQPLLTQSAG